MVIALKKRMRKVEIFGLNVLPVGVVLPDCPGSTEEVISHLFLHKPTVNIHILNSKSNLKNEYIYPSY